MKVDRRTRIIKAARELFQTRDYESATMQELIDTLQIAKGTLYHHFKSKQELLGAVVEDIVTEDLEQKKQLLDSPAMNALNACEKLTALVRSADISGEHEQMLENLHKAGNVELHSRLLGVYVERLAPLIAGVIEQGRNEGVFTTVCPLEAAEFLLAGLQFLTDSGFYCWSEQQLLRRAAAFSAIVEAQLGAAPGSLAALSEKKA